jgi:phosphotransferase system IIB component
MAKGFCVAGRDILAESGFSENVANLKACQTMFAVTLVAAGNSRG